jgi:outer membrane protein assembly factor BamC
LYVPETPEALWPRLRSFWGTYEISLTADEPRVGVMETDWKQDPLELDDGLISRIFAGIADSGLRDRFRLRLERSPDGQGTLVFLSHRGAEQVGIADSSGNVTGFVWQPRASDPQLEAEMLARLQQHLGGEPAVSDEGVVVAGSAYAVQSEAEGEPVLILNDSFERAWRRVGVTLDRIGLLVDEQARSDGIYYVTYNPAITREPQGFFAGLFDFRPGDELDEGVRFQVHLDEFDGGVRLKVRNAQGEVPERERALVVLGRLQAEFP